MLHKSTLFALTALLITLTSGSAFAEDAALGGIGIKFGGAFTNATFSGDAGSLPSPKDDIGYSAGIQGVFGINSYIAIQPELLYTNKGYQLLVDGGGSTNNEVTENLDYIQLPILVSLRLPLLRVFTPKLLVGPHVAYKIGGSTFTEEPDGSTRTNPHNADNFNPIDFGFTLGAGADIGLESFTLNVELRYEIGLLGVDAREGDTNFTHSQVGFMLGILI